MIESTVCEFVCQPKLDRVFFGYDIKEQVYHVMIAAKVFLMSCTSGDRRPPVHTSSKLQNWRPFDTLPSQIDLGQGHCELTFVFM